jgi:hypothetical protein
VAVSLNIPSKMSDRGKEVFMAREVMEIDGKGPYRRRWSGREPVALILILAIVAIWMYRNSGGEFFGRRFGEWLPSPVNTPPVEVQTVPVPPPVAPVEEFPTVAVEPRPVITPEPQSDIIGYSRVVSERTNLRAGPGYEYRVIASLPRHWEVAILNQLHITPNGDMWVEVLTETDYGRRNGWVMRQYLELESCNCPAP